MVASTLALAVYGLHFVVPTSIITLPHIGMYSAIAAAIALIIGIYSLVATHTEDLDEHARLSFLTIAVLVAAVLYDTGPLTSPFILVWGAVSVAAPVFGLFGILPVLAITFGMPLFLTFSGHFSFATAWYAITYGVVPMVFGFFIKPKANVGRENKEDRSYHALAKELSQATGKAEVVIGAIGEGVIAVDGQGVIELINPAAIQMVGWGKEDALGLNYKSILKLQDAKGNDIDQSRDPVALTFTSNNTTTDNTLTLVTQSGKKLLVALQVSPLGQPGSGAIAVFRDITKEKAEEHEQAEFISTASHEMRTPVAEIEGYLGLVLNPQTATIDDKARDFIGKAHAAAQHLGHLFQDLLDVSKAEDGRMQNNPKVVDVGKFMTDVIESLRPKAEQKGLSLIYQSETPDTRPRGIGKLINPSFYVNVDNDHLREIADNLVENAIKYTAKGQVNVRVDGDDQHVKISIADTGLGIPREDVPHLFQKFYRVDNSQTREIGGTGLGLYLCRKLVEGMGGRIWVESTFGQGSTFYVELPRTASAEADRMIQEIEQESTGDTQPEAPIAVDAVQPTAPAEQPPQLAPMAPPLASAPLVQPVPASAIPLQPAAPQAPVAQPQAYAPIPRPLAEHPNTPLTTIEQNPRGYISQTEARTLNIPIRNG